jgi:regulator of protease activity HflC (stomatin/prohibitin superfamily)
MEALEQVEFLDVELVVAALLVLLAIILGLLLQRTVGGRGIGGAILMGFPATMAAGTCLAGTAIGAASGQSNGALIGLLAGMVVSCIFIWLFFKVIVRGGSGRFMAAQWVSFCALCLIGYLAGGELGLLTVTLPCLVMFWLVLSRISWYTLPASEEVSRSMTFRCLLTHAMGTNYPYYTVRRGTVEERFRGNPFLQFFAGPGIVFADVDQGAIVHDNMAITQVFGPGLNFTRVFEQPPRALDLRPQIRSFPIQALTRDGIPIHTQLSVAFRLRESRLVREPGASYKIPMRTAGQLATTEYAERGHQPLATPDTHQWDGELIRLLLTPVMLDILSHYSIDDLCKPRIPGLAPRAEIAAELRSSIKHILSSQGLELVACWFDNLSPRAPSVLQRRTANWRTAWENRILKTMSESRAQRAKVLEVARGEAEKNILARFSEIAKEGRYDANLSQTALALRFIDCLGEILSESKKQWPLPESYEETLELLRGELVDEQR